MQQVAGSGKSLAHNVLGSLAQSTKDDEKMLGLSSNRHHLATRRRSHLAKNRNVAQGQLVGLW